MWIRPCNFASSLCSSFVLLNGRRGQFVESPAFSAFDCKLPLLSRDSGPSIFPMIASIPSSIADAMCAVAEPGESVKNELSPNTICSSSRWSVSLQNCSQTSRSSVQNAYRQGMQWQQAPCPSDKCIMNCQHLSEFSCRFVLRRNNAQIQARTEKGKASVSSALVTMGLLQTAAGAIVSICFEGVQR
jgi:hypothetical protein